MVCVVRSSSRLHSLLQRYGNWLMSITALVIIIILVIGLLIRTETSFSEHVERDSEFGWEAKTVSDTRYNIPPLLEGGRRHRHLRENGQKIVLFSSSLLRDQLQKVLNVFYSHPQVFVWPKPIELDTDKALGFILNILYCRSDDLTEDDINELRVCNEVLQVKNTEQNCAKIDKVSVNQLCSSADHVAVSVLLPDSEENSKHSLLLEELKFMPSTHVLHLVEDPRNTLSNELLASTDSFETLMQALVASCTYTDSLLHELYSQRLWLLRAKHTVIRIEDLVNQHNSGVLDLLNVIDIAPPAIEDWVERVQSKLYTERTQSGRAGRQWPGLDFTALQRIQQSCFSFMNRTGYYVVSDYDQLRLGQLKLRTRHLPPVVLEQSQTTSPGDIVDY